MSVILKDYKGNVVDVNSQPDTVLERIVGNDNGHKIPFVGHDAQEATLLKFKGHVYLYYTMGHYVNNVRHESIVVAEYNPETNVLLSDVTIVADLNIFNIIADHYKASFFWVEEDYIYGIVTLWTGNTISDPNYVNKCIMIKSTDALHFTIVSDNIVDNLFPSSFPNSWYGNHCVIKVSESKWYWYIELMSNGWQTYLIQSNLIESGWELVGKCNIDSTLVGGVRGYLDNDKIKIIFHYGGLPTRLGYSEADISSPLNFTNFYRPLLDYTTRTIFPYLDLIADPELAEVNDNTYMIASYVLNSYGFEAEIWIWKCSGRLKRILNSQVPYPVS